jgi:hypothetical protein
VTKAGTALKASNYCQDDKLVWDSFISNSKNGVFLFQRDYMEYHADRFVDFSIMFHDDDGRLLAVMPASIRDGIVTSHGGLTFGGIVTDNHMKAPLMLEAFDTLKTFLEERGVSKLVYKVIPHIYHHYPAEEDLYGLFRSGGRLIRRDISSTIAIRSPLPFSKGRKYSIKQARKFGLVVQQNYDFDTFMEIEEKLLGAKYDVKPTHNASELSLLASRFPDHIKLFSAFDTDVMVAGVVIYEHEKVAHAQYIAATDHGKRIGALDLILEHLVTERYASKEYFDFGISTENLGIYLNEGLIENKQSFGARAVVHDFYEIDIAPRIISL